jgi:SAM-dependent methyltransferase
LVLDTGCGTGRHALALAARGVRVVGVDNAARLLEVARRAAGAAPWPRFVRATYDALPFADATFDAVLCLGSSLGYQGEAGDRAALGEFRRVLRAGARLIVETLHRDQLDGVLPLVERRRLPDGTVLRFWRHFEPELGVLRERQQLREGSGTGPVRCYEMRVYRPSELCALLRDAGFVAVTYHGPLLGDGASHPDRALVLVADTAATEPLARCAEPWPARAFRAARLDPTAY